MNVTTGLCILFGLVLLCVHCPKNLKLYLRSMSGNGWTTVSSSYTLATHTWTRVLMSFNKDNKRAYLQVGNDIFQENLGSERRFNAPGKIRIGERLSPGGSGYQGHMACLGFFDVRVTVGDHRSEFTCSSGGSSSCPVYDPSYFLPTTTTTKVATTTTVAPLSSLLNQLWPLDSVTRTRDVMDTVTHITGPDDCFRTAPVTPVSLWPSPYLMLDGSRGSEVNLAATPWGPAWTVAAVVVAPQLKEGLMWRYTHGGGTPLTVELAFQTDGSSVVLSVYQNSGQACGQLTASATWPTMLPTLVVAALDASNLLLQIGGQAWTAFHSCTALAAPSGAANLQVGGKVDESQDGGAGFRGHVMCLGVATQYLADVDMDELRLLCTGYDPALHAVDTSFCSETQDIVSGKYRILARDSQPDPALGPFAPLTSLTASSTAQCANACLLNLNCRSFLRSASLCNLFDFVTEQGLTTTQGHYYEIRA